MAYFRCNSSSGGGGTNVRTGTVSVTTAGQTISFDTGLQNIEFLYCEFFPSIAAKAYGMVKYDSDHPTVYRSLVTTGSTPNGATYDIGTSAVSRCMTLNSINNGVVQLTAPTQGNTYVGDVTWYAW